VADAKPDVKRCCSYGASEVFGARFQLLTDDGRMFATESSEPDSIGAKYSSSLFRLTARTTRRDPND